MFIIDTVLNFDLHGHSEITCKQPFYTFYSAGEENWVYHKWTKKVE